MKFPYGIVDVPHLVERKSRGAKEPRAEWHGKDCEILGRCPDYAAIRFPWHGGHDYEIIKNEFVITKGPSEKRSQS